MPHQPGFNKFKASDDRRACIYDYNRLPKLIYEPFVWAEEDRAEWIKTGHSGTCS